MTNSNIDIKPNEYLANCNNRDIISFDSRDPIFVYKLFDLIKLAFNSNSNIFHTISNSITQKLKCNCDAKLWFQDGEKCEILKAGSSGWQKGKIKLKLNISLEFIPDKPEEIESPLDDIRQAEINNIE
ncbi:KGK domain-containing protein [Pleurocapsa sp. PCC 7319]|uniref:KGK domain-containing protein n=1 Tax=Pleurocapsa sp. PCC 7319 TaxID=118161 RepID=UPI00034AEC5D|nr:KGK domain-containing protein [Pleurocapsa sp. PCC 7319]